MTNKTVIALTTITLIIYCAMIGICFTLPYSTDTSEPITSTCVAESLNLTNAFVSSVSEGTKTINATVYPESATSRLQWTISWQNPTSEWASGKSVSDYLSLSVSSNKSTATVECKAAFGEQAIITASCDDLSKTITVDYTQQLLSFEVYFRGTNNTYFKATLAEGASSMSIKYGGDYPFYSGVDYEGEYIAEFTDGTIVDNGFEVIFSTAGGETRFSDIRQLSSSDLGLPGCETISFGVRFGNKTYWATDIECY